MEGYIVRTYGDTRDPESLEKIRPIWNLMLVA